jgi:hypothetical protein
MSLAGSLAASLLATLTRPSWWAMALAGFLVRGGILVLILPIVALPTVAGLATTFGPVVVELVFGGPSTAFVTAVASISAAVLAWLVIGGLVGGSLDLALVREAADDEELEGGPRPAAGSAFRAFALRIVAHLPTTAVLAFGAVRLVEATYDELIHPGDPALPIPLRVAFRIPEIVALLTTTWLVGEAVGGLAVRHLAWGASSPRALVAGAGSLLRPSALATAVVTNLVLAAVIVASSTAAGIAWDHLRVVLLDGASAADVRLALAVFATTWASGLWLLSLAVTWRSTAWTFEVARQLPTRTIEPPTG